LGKLLNKREYGGNLEFSRHQFLLNKPKPNIGVDKDARKKRQAPVTPAVGCLIAERIKAKIGVRPLFTLISITVNNNRGGRQHVENKVDFNFDSSSWVGRVCYFQIGSGKS
jgi:hypothetical protein